MEDPTEEIELRSINGMPLRHYASVRLVRRTATKRQQFPLGCRPPVTAT
jgi:hypothetical protein